MLTIDGSFGEGGGQVLRTALTLSVLTGRPVAVERIRAGRTSPGLRPQHLTAVRAAAALCDARLTGDELGSQTLRFEPAGPARSGEYLFDVAEAAHGGSAGSIGLVFQTVLLPLAMAAGDSRIILRGGTHVAWAPSVSYLQEVFLPQVERMGVQAELVIKQWGFYPAGGGAVEAVVAGRPGPLSPTDLDERGDLKRVWGTAAVTNLPAHIPQRMTDRARNVLGQAGLRAQVTPSRLRGNGPGAGIFLFAEYAEATAGFTAYGRKGLPAEQVAETACQHLLDHHRSGAGVDPHLADQLVLPMCLAEGESRLSTSQVTGHLLTNVWVVEQFLDREIVVRGEVGEPGGLRVKGASLD